MVGTTESLTIAIEKEDYLWLEATVDDYFLYSKRIPGVSFEAWVPVCGLIEALLNGYTQNVEQRLIESSEVFTQLRGLPEIQRILDIAQTFISAAE